MEILCKCDKYIYFKYYDSISILSLYASPDCSNIKHLNDCQPICKLISNYEYEYDVYYIHNETVIIKSSNTDFIITRLYHNDKLDYTEANINKLKYGNIMEYNNKDESIKANIQNKANSIIYKANYALGRAKVNPVILLNVYVDNDGIVDISRVFNMGYDVYGDDVRIRVKYIMESISLLERSIETIDKFCKTIKDYSLYEHIGLDTLDEIDNIRKELISYQFKLAKENLGWSAIV